MASGIRSCLRLCRVGLLSTHHARPSTKFRIDSNVVDHVGVEHGHRRALARQPAAARAVERQAAHMALLPRNPLHRRQRRAQVLQPRLITRHNRALGARDPTREVVPPKAPLERPGERLDLRLKAGMAHQLRRPGAVAGPVRPAHCLKLAQAGQRFGRQRRHRNAQPLPPRRFRVNRHRQPGPVAVPEFLRIGRKPPGRRHRRLALASSLEPVPQPPRSPQFSHCPWVVTENTAQFERVLPAVEGLLDPGHGRGRVPINRSCALRQRGPLRLVDRPRQHRRMRIRLDAVREGGHGRKQRRAGRRVVRHLRRRGRLQRAHDRPHLGQRRIVRYPKRLRLVAHDGRQLGDGIRPIRAIPQ